MSPPVEGSSTADPDQGFGRALRTVRLAAGMSQEDLADACGRHPTYISLLERGRRSPTLRTLFLIGQALGVRPSEMLRRLEEGGRD